MSPYALTKAQGEQWGELYSGLHGIRFIALRFFTVWGEGQRQDLALAAFSKALREGRPVRVNGDGHQRRDLTHVSDVARAVALAVRYQGADFAAFNVGTGWNHSVLEMVKAAERFTGQKAAIEHGPAHPIDVPETRASTVKSRIALGWHAETRFQPTAPVSVKKV
jgi:UDP-glucuronate 4-epimerase